MERGRAHGSICFVNAVSRAFSSWAVRVFPVLSLRRVRSSVIPDLFSYGFTGHMIKTCMSHWNWEIASLLSNVHANWSHSWLAERRVQISLEVWISGSMFGWGLKYGKGTAQPHQNFRRRLLPRVKAYWNKSSNFSGGILYRNTCGTGDLWVVTCVWLNVGCLSL